MTPGNVRNTLRIVRKKKARPPFKPKPALRAYREEHGLEAAAKKAGVAESTWRSYENGWREMDADACINFERKLGIQCAVIRPDLFRRVAAGKEAVTA